MVNINKEWKKVLHNNKETQYLISNEGEVYNTQTEVLHKGGITNSGYLCYGLSLKNKQSIKEYAHRLVAVHFIPNPEGKPQVNHIDGDKLNNHVSNLEWVTQEENMRHCMDAGLSKLTKPIEQYSLSGEFIAEHNSASDAARQLGDIKMGRTISNALIGKYVSAFGFQWKFKNEAKEIRPLKEGEYFTKKSVVQLTLDGEFIQMFDTVHEAYKAIGKTDNGVISQVCKGNRNKYLNYKWMCLSDYIK